VAQKRKIAREIVDVVEGDYRETLQKARHFQVVLTHLQYEGKASWGRNIQRARELSRFLSQEVNGHMGEEERTVFPFLQSHIPKLESLISLLCLEHQDFKKNLISFQSLLETLAKKRSGARGRLMGKLKEKGMYLIYLLQGHLLEESGILYKVAERELRRDEKRELIRRIRVTKHPSEIKIKRRYAKK